MRGLGPNSEAAFKFRRRDVRVVSIIVVQEGEKGTIRPPVAQPVKKRLVELAVRPAIEDRSTSRRRSCRDSGRF